VTLWSQGGLGRDHPHPLVYLLEVKKAAALLFALPGMNDRGWTKNKKSKASLLDPDRRSLLH
jgi:hypothetical protein